jgi:hypothetical protein
MNSRFHAPRGTRGNAGLAEKETLLGEMRKEERRTRVAAANDRQYSLLD